MPYQGEKGEQVISSFRKTVKRLLPSNTKLQVSITGNKLVYISTSRAKLSLNTDLM